MCCPSEASLGGRFAAVAVQAPRQPENSYKSTSITVNGLPAGAPSPAKFAAFNEG
jgi:hypothetical protein